MAAAGEDDEKLSLLHIVKSFDAGLNEEQAWAICFQCSRHMFRYRRSCHEFSLSLESVFVRSDGYVFIERHCSGSGSRRRNEKSGEYEKINLLGRTIFDALDYGLKEDEERELSTPLEELIDLMTNEDDSESINQHGDEVISLDEGIVDEHLEGENDSDEPATDSGNSYPEIGEEEGEFLNEDVSDIMNAILECTDGINTDNGKITLVQILKLCARRLPDLPEAPGHYQQVCRVLYTEVQELNSFLETISAGKRCLQKLKQICPDEPEDQSHHELNELDNREWARMWIQLIKQLRAGVQLKKVGKINQMPIEYALTPYEILMDDIRSKRYELNKIMVDGDIPPRVQKEAHDVILDFIRSRPPLKAVSERKLNPVPPRRESVHDIMMREIRSEPRLKPPEIKKGASTPALNQIGVPEFEGFLQRNTPLTSSKKKILKEDIVFDWNASDSESEDESKKMTNRRSREQVQMDENDEFKTASFPDLPNLLEKKSKLQLNIAKSPFQRSLANQNGGGLGMLRKQFRHSIMICQYHNVKKVPEESSRKEEEPGPVALDVNPRHVNASSDFLSLTVDEVMHIRSVLIKADIENLRINKKLYKEVVKEKVCFLCHKKWSLFQKRYKCKLCKRTVCHGCCKKMHIPSDRFVHIPVNSLSPVSPPVSPLGLSLEGTQSVNLGTQPRVGGSVPPHVSTPTNTPPTARKKDNLETISGTSDVCMACKEFMKQVLRSDNFQTKSLHQQQKFTHV